LKGSKRKEAGDKHVRVVLQENIKYGGRINMIHSLKKNPFSKTKLRAV
jgi:hypothetical protein